LDRSDGIAKVAVLAPCDTAAIHWLPVQALTHSIRQKLLEVSFVVAIMGPWSRGIRP
jgi:hypothetical protein